MPKKLTKENYYLPCEEVQIYRKINFLTNEILEAPTEEYFIEVSNTLQLSELVPLFIHEIFEPVKALYAYGYLYYPFFTLSVEQSYKAFEAACAEKYRTIGGLEYSKKGYPISFSKKIDYLFNIKVIDGQLKEIFDGIRYLRNASAHPKSQNILPPDITFQESIAKFINMLFE